jgi:pyridoxal phosphate enzyme (YggS family)
MTAAAEQDRRDEVVAGLRRVEERISDACRAAGRARETVTLVVVTKFFPASDVRLLHELGVRDVGENRHQEAFAKREQCSGLSLRWHFIGGLQSNKAAAVGSWADVVQSVDRARLLPGLSRAAHERGVELDVLVQVSLDPRGRATDGHGGRSGVAPYDAVPLAVEAARGEGLHLRGVMGVAPLGADPSEAFGRLVEVSGAIRAEVPTATWLSAGMSGDLEQAVHAGATHVRVGSAVLGNRPTPR